MNRYEFFAGPGRVEAAAAQVAQYRTSAAPCRGETSVHGYQELLDRFSDYQFSAWHDAGAHFKRLFHLRSIRARAVCPITFTHHTISYQFMLHDRMLPLLLADSYPCDAVVCTSKASRVAFEKLLDHVGGEFDRAFHTSLAYRGRLEVIPLGVDTDLFRPREKTDLRHQLGLPKEAFIILWFGRFSVADKMDLLPLMRVFKLLAPGSPTQQLLLVLAGTERDNYASVVEDYAQLFGLRDRVLVLRSFPTVNRHLLHAAADVFVSPADNIQETFGLTPIEAMACGVPQVVADWDGYRDTVVHGGTGFLVPTYWARCDADLRATAAIYPWEFDHLSLAQSVVVDPAAYRLCLQRLIDDEGMRARMARRSRERALALYSWHTVIGQYEALWEELAESAIGVPMDRAGTTIYNQPPYFDAFCHYATAVISDRAHLRLTAAGTRMLRGREALPSYLSRLECLSADLLQEALVALKVSRRLGRGYDLGGLVEDLAGVQVRHPDAVRRHVMWLMKHGFVEVIGGQAESPAENGGLR
jgi:glycosyltransferase involved in cell wall biosynthesis